MTGSVPESPSRDVPRLIVIVLLIPPLAVMGAILWNAWAGRPRRPEPPLQSVESYRRHLEALAPTEEQLLKTTR